MKFHSMNILSNMTKPLDQYSVNHYTSYPCYA